MDERRLATTSSVKLVGGARPGDPMAKMVERVSRGHWALYAWDGRRLANERGAG